MKAGLALFFAICVFVIPVFADDEHHHGPETGEKLGTVHFPISCSPEAQQQFDQADAMLHSFWYEEAQKAFTQVTVTDPGCAMGYWGIAMSLYHPLWATPPSPAELQQGSAAVQKAKTMEIKTDREKDYIGAIESY